jgi:hypothetical protein
LNGPIYFILESDTHGDVLKTASLGRWIVDEVVPIDAGVRHRIEFESGSLTVDSLELKGRWR